jgi:NO-binding membrane sensor protein with MHYT domain
MNPEVIATDHRLGLVLLSFAISAIGAYTALAAAAAAVRRSRPGHLDRLNVVLAGLSLGGIAIWAMHFIGMIAWQVEIGVGYRLLETLVSLVAAVVVSTVALGWVVASGGKLSRIAVAGPLAGLGVAAMHYLGMASMRFSGYFVWDMAIVALSVFIAMAAASAALWLAFRTPSRSHRAGAALLMAGAVCTMHYTGMAGATVVCTSREPNPLLAQLLRPADLPVPVIAVAGCIALIIGLDLWMQRMTGQRRSADTAATARRGLRRPS